MLYWPMRKKKCSLKYGPFLLGDKPTFECGCGQRIIGFWIDLTLHDKRDIISTCPVQAICAALVSWSIRTNREWTTDTSRPYLTSFWRTRDNCLHPCHCLAATFYCLFVRKTIYSLRPPSVPLKISFSSKKSKILNFYWIFNIYGT